ncbi:MAG: helix-turn-helix transcriptional regulator [bacterium]|nr:helix-turn-helix transcriptional regulator [bacterium]
MLKPEYLRYLGAALSALRTRAGLTQAAVAKRAESMHPPQISRYEHGHEEPTVSSLVKYLSAIDADFADLQEELEVQARSSELEREVGSALDEFCRKTQSRLPHVPEMRKLLAEMMRPTLDEVRVLRRRLEEIERERGGGGED